MRKERQFLHDAPGVPDGGPRIPVADGIDPEDAIFPSQPEHDVFLAQGVAIPVVTEANDVLAFDHSY